MKHDTTMLEGTPRFQPTSWTLVRSARDFRALHDLVSRYWKPLYFFVRHHGYDNETSKDIVQEFLMTIIEREALEKADPARGRFRTFLLTALSNFMKDWARTAGRRKRGGDLSILSLDFRRGEEEYQVQVAAGETPEHVLNRAWARGIWERAIGELRGDPAHLAALRLYLDQHDYKSIAKRTGLTPGAAKVAVHRLKIQLQDVLVGHLRQTVADEEGLRLEMAEFRELLS